MDEDRDSLLLLLLKEGSTEQAVKLYQEETGLHYADAQVRVNALASRHGLRSRRLAAWAVPLLIAASVLVFFLSH